MHSCCAIILDWFTDLYVLSGGDFATNLQTEWKQSDIKCKCEQTDLLKIGNNRVRENCLHTEMQIAFKKEKKSI